MEDVLAAHAAVVQVAKSGDEVKTAALKSSLPSSHKVRDGKNKAKDLCVAFMCSAETRYLAHMDALANAINKDASLLENLPLPPLNVALIWHSHTLSPVRYADDIQRRYGSTLEHVDFPVLRLAKAHMCDDQAGLEAAHVDDTKATAKVQCPSCRTEQALTVAEYAAFRLHEQAPHIFVDKMVAHAMYHAHTFALTQYQLHPWLYATQTRMLTGRVVNHDDADDKVSEARIIDGAQGMPALWMDLCGENYETPHVSSCTARTQTADEPMVDQEPSMTCCTDPSWSLYSANKELSKTSCTDPYWALRSMDQESSKPCYTDLLY
ncbi:hypothetical protein AMAG_05243 [Allomyces macrogynus ATCC 38327]|uniref:Uncharacterized protein n=1 Tax=Allomyces macrogynus (strain ATCC 38327) TaxID=578462 RepID=A0A0L0SBJ1_ALLM3|nr:hypothetical protein AMAG_05243 [Allomyces macrogynus ATCC 38327]|eukprot:KNE59779.1 hypothetical protein AMAG_05243 [Allomyces macrogynus ATCC 38327]